MAAELGAVYVKTPAAPRGVTWGDWIEIAGVFVVLALYASVAASVARSHARSSGGSAAGPATAPFFLLLLAAFTSYALGHGMHVAANAIHDMMGSGVRSELRDLVYFWDERAGHVGVDAARVAFVIGLVSLEGNGTAAGASGRRPAGAETGGTPGGPGILLVVGTAAYGFIYFATAIEGQTVFLALPFTAILAWMWLRDRGNRPSVGTAAPARAFFTNAAMVSLLLFLVYGLWQRGFPEFTRAGIL
jgi:hypothetical protein